MSEYGKADDNSGRGNETVEGTTEAKTGRRWTRRVLWVAIIVAGLLVACTIAEILSGGW